MTAEVAILNANAVALAADSAVTSGVRGRQKVFNSANKLFALSKYHPVGVMVFGGAHFMGVPWETIVKVYRARLGDQSFPYLVEYVDDFVRFLSENKMILPPSQHESYVEATIQSYFSRLLDEILNRIEDLFKGRTEVSVAETGRTAHEIVLEHHQKWLATDRVESAPQDIETIILRDYEKVIERILDTTFERQNLQDETKEFLRSLAVLLLSRARGTGDDSSGLVVTGFGESEIYPSVRWVNHVEIALCGFLKRSPFLDEKIQYGGQAAIIPFAQREMVSTFMEGIDPGYRVYLDEFISGILSQYSETVATAVYPNADQQTEALRVSLQEVNKTILQEYRERSLDYSRLNHSGPIVDVVGALPKDELAAMAEALVNLTSFKRRISMDTETVGGPIDVAVISKGDGFVWIKRKHYFKPELNAHFVANYFRRPKNAATQP